jgi:hypothetical protein
VLVNILIIHFRLLFDFYQILTLINKGWSSGGKGICTNDYGGPLYYLDPSTNKHILAGITSFRSSGGCGLSSVSEYVNFEFISDLILRVVTGDYPVSYLWSIFFN